MVRVMGSNLCGGWVVARVLNVFGGVGVGKVVVFFAISVPGCGNKMVGKLDRKKYTWMISSLKTKVG